jgi:hypothetical protein
LIIDGHIEAVQGDLMQVKLTTPEQLNPLRIRQLAAGKQPSVSVEVEDGRKISPDQRRKIWALLNDYADYTGYNPLEMEAYTKAYFMAETGHEYFSMSNCSMSLASDYLTHVIDFGFDHDIPWKFKHIDSIPSAYPLMMQCLKHRICIICGKRAEIDHEPPIGRSGNRHHIDNRKYKFFPLCHEHHQIRHLKGIKWFMEFYHIKPVKLDEESLIALHMNSRKQFSEFDEKQERKESEYHRAT